jgi:hypothetical protein
LFPSRDRAFLYLIPILVWYRCKSGFRTRPENAAKACENMAGAIRKRYGTGPVRLACEAHFGMGES